MISSNVRMCSWCEIREAVWRAEYVEPTQSMHLCRNTKCIQKEFRDACDVGIGNAILVEVT